MNIISELDRVIDFHWFSNNAPVILVGKEDKKLIIFNEKTLNHSHILKKMLKDNSNNEEVSSFYFHILPHLLNDYVNIEGYAISANKKEAYIFKKVIKFKELSNSSLVILLEKQNQISNNSPNFYRPTKTPLNAQIIYLCLFITGFLKLKYSVT